MRVNKSRYSDSHSTDIDSIKHCALKGDQIEDMIPGKAYELVGETKPICMK